MTVKTAHSRRVRPKGKTRRVRAVVFCLLVTALWYFQFFSFLLNGLAIRQLRVDHFDRTEKLLRWSVSLRDRNPETYRLLARLNQKLSQFEEFSKHIKMFSDLGGDPNIARREEILFRATTGEARALMSELANLLIDQEGDADEVCSAFANGFLVDQEFEQAFVLIDQWKINFPDDPRPHAANGRVQDYLSNNAVAEKEYNDALLKCPSHYPSAFALGRLYLESQHPREALELYSRCLSMGKNAAAKIGAAKCYRQLGDTEQARKLLLEVIDLPREELVISYRYLGEVLEGEPAALELGSIELGAGNNEAALKHLTTAYNADPTDLDVRYTRAMAMRQCGQVELGNKELQAVNDSRKALQIADKIVDKINPLEPHVEERVRVGQLYLENGSLRTAEYWLKSALAFDSRSLAAHELLAELYSRKARKDKRLEPDSKYHKSRVQELSPGSSSDDTGNPPQ